MLSLSNYGDERGYSMIPKVIHYFWLGGGKKSNLTNICISSWKEKMPEYKIIEWNENNLDLDKIAEENRFFRECRKRKLWAFMVDYLRLLILYEHGGVYMDTDVQAIKSLNPLMNNEAFIGKEAYGYLGTGMIACNKHNKVIKEVLEFYNDEIWHSKLYTIPMIMTETFKRNKENDFVIYPMEYFAPYNYNEDFDYSVIGENTYAIHWFDGSWTNDKRRIFLATKHIDNKILRGIIVTKKYIGFYVKKFIKR